MANKNISWIKISVIGIVNVGDNKMRARVSYEFVSLAADLRFIERAGFLFDVKTSNVIQAH